MHKIREYFEQLVNINNSYWELFSSKLLKSEYPKKTTLLKIGQTEKHLSLIEKGAIRFFIPKIDNDLTFVFCFENQFVSAYDSFLTQKPCDYQLETLTKTTLWRISHKNL